MWKWCGDHTGLIMNHTAYLTPQESMLQISNQSVKPFNLEIGEHSDIESQDFYIDFNKLSPCFFLSSYTISHIIHVNGQLEMIFCQPLLLYHTVRGQVFESYMKKTVFLLLFFSKYLKNGWNYSRKKIVRNHDISVYKKALISGHRKNYIFRHNNCFVKISVSLLVSLCVTNFLWTS